MVSRVVDVVRPRENREGGALYESPEPVRQRLDQIVCRWEKTIRNRYMPNGVKPILETIPQARPLAKAVSLWPASWPYRAPASIPGSAPHPENRFWDSLRAVLGAGWESHPERQTLLHGQFWGFWNRWPSCPVSPPASRPGKRSCGTRPALRQSRLLPCRPRAVPGYAPLEPTACGPCTCLSPSRLRCLPVDAPE